MTLNKILMILYKFGNWLMNFMFLNLLWVVFTIVGLGVFGIFPATAAVFNVIYKWITQHVDISIYETFKTYYKDNFKSSNIVGLIIVLTTLFLYVDLRISLLFIKSFLFHYFLLAICLLFLIILLYLFTIQSRYKLSVSELFKQSFLIAFAAPFEAIAMLISFALILIFYWNYPFILALVGVPLLVAPLVWFGYLACTRIEKKKIV